MDNIAGNYRKRYADRSAGKLYPTEFVVRVFLGSYPRLKFDKSSFPRSKILDLGSGDGRNLPLLRDLGFTTYAVEIDDGICDLLRKRVSDLGLDTVVRTGSNSMIPFENAFFDYALCCHSLYYVKPGQAFHDNLRELARVIRSGGMVVASLPRKDSYTLRQAEPIGDDHFIIRNDPLGLRNGVVFRAFDTTDEIERVFGGLFRNFQIGSIKNDFFGIDEHLWIVVMTRC